MNPFYTFEIYVSSNKEFINYFWNQKPLCFPISRSEVFDNIFIRQCIVEMTRLAMLSFYGCLDSELL